MSESGHAIHAPKIYLLYAIGYLDHDPFVKHQTVYENHAPSQ